MASLPERHPDVAVPTPRDSLDTGSIAELVADCDDVHLDVQEARAWPTHHEAIAVPDDASTLLEGLGAYGS